jgi:hypothetical protein
VFSASRTIWLSIAFVICHIWMCTALQLRHGEDAHQYYQTPAIAFAVFIVCLVVASRIYSGIVA